MTLEKLIQIVMEAVEKVVRLERLQVSAVVFQAENRTETENAAQSINGRVNSVACPESIKNLAPCDVLVLDQIPARYLPKLALGLTDDPFTTYVGEMIICGKKIFVLKEELDLPGSTPKSCKLLLRAYQDLLKAHGVIFTDKSAPLDFDGEVVKGGPCGRISSDEGESNTAWSGREDPVYTGNVLSKRDILELTENGGRSIKVAESVIITELALETAENLNITIKRV